MSEKSKYEIGEFGPIYTQFKGKPTEAIRFLMEKQDGEAVAALHRDDIGDIDIIWGRNDDNDSGLGLKHIIEKHKKEWKFYKIDISLLIPELVKNGIKDEDRSNEVKLVLYHEIYRGVIKLEYNKKIKRFLLSAFVPNFQPPSRSSALKGLKNEMLVPSFTENLGKDNTFLPNSKKIFLGAVEVLQQNHANLDFQGYKPSYKILSSYDHLIELVPGNIVFSKDGNLNLTVKKIIEVANQYKWQVKGLASHLKADTAKQTAFNIWHFIKTNIGYHLDTPGTEEIRTPSRTWKDRQTTKADCEDYAIFSASLLLNMGYDPYLYIVGFYGREEFSHIYTVLNGIPIDGVMNIFGIHPQFITKTMKISVLNGLKNINGLAGADDSVTLQLIKQHNIIAKEAVKNSALAKDLRKIRFALLTDGLPGRAHYLELLQYVDDIDTKTGRYIFKNSEVDKVFNSIPVSGLGALPDEQIALLSGYYKLNDTDRSEFNSIGNIFDKIESAELGSIFSKAAKVVKNVAQKVGETVKKVAEKVADTTKTVVKKAGEVAKTVLKAVVKYNPLTIAARNGLLLSMRINLFGMAAKLKWGYLTSDQAQSQNLNMEQYNKVVDSLKKTEKLFTNIGGNANNLKEAIIKGGKGLPVTAANTTANPDIIAHAPETYGEAKKIGGGRMSGLGEPVTAAAITAAMGLITAIVKFLKDNGVDPKKLLEKIPTLLQKEQSIPEGDANNISPEATDGLVLDEYEDEQKTNWLPWIIGSGALIFISGMFLIKK